MLVGNAVITLLVSSLNHITVKWSPSDVAILGEWFSRCGRIRGVAIGEG